MNFLTLLLRFLIVSILLFVGSLSYFVIFSYPVALQKILSLEAIDQEYPAAFSSSARGMSLEEIRHHIEAIPYKEHPTTVYSVLPREKYVRTIKEGDGNCSNLIFGAAWDLINDGRGVSIIHLLPKDGSYLTVYGHTVLQVKGQETNPIIVDYLEGGVPLADGQTLNLESLQNTHSSFAHLSYNARRDDYNRFFQRKNLEQYYYGLITQEDITRYFDFVEFVYFPLPTEKISKLTFDLSALLLGYYPKIYVHQQVIDDLWVSKKADILSALTVKYSFWACLILTFLLLLHLLAYPFRRLKAKKRQDRA